MTEDPRDAVVEAGRVVIESARKVSDRHVTMDRCVVCFRLLGDCLGAICEPDCEGFKLRAALKALDETMRIATRDGSFRLDGSPPPDWGTFVPDGHGGGWYALQRDVYFDTLTIAAGFDIDIKEHKLFGRIVCEDPTRLPQRRPAFVPHPPHAPRRHMP